MNWLHAVGRRCLVKPDWGSLAEVIVLEVASSGEYVKFRTLSGKEFWDSARNVTLKEILPKSAAVGNL